MSVCDAFGECCTAARKYYVEREVFWIGNGGATSGCQLCPHFSSHLYLYLLRETSTFVIGAVYNFFLVKEMWKYIFKIFQKSKNQNLVIHIHTTSYTTCPLGKYSNGEKKSIH